MKSFFVPGACLVLGLVGLVQPLSAVEPFGSASLLPMPSVQEPQPIYPLVTPTSFGQEEISPSDQAPAAAFAPPPVGMSQDYQQAMKGAWDGAGCTDGSCDVAMECCGRPCPHWAVWGGGLFMGRANQCYRPVTLDSGTMQNVLSTNAVEQDWSGGFEVGAAWIMPNCCNAISIGYWGLFPTNQRAALDAANTVGGISPVLGNVDQLDYSDGVVTDNVFNVMSTSSGTHEVAMGGSFNSLEINFLANTQAWGLAPFGSGCGGGCNSCNPCGACCKPCCWQFGWLAGLRYFRMNEYFLLETDVDDPMINDPGDTNELDYRIDVENNLWGFQFGGQGAWYLCNCWSIYGSGRFGVYNNHITSDQFMTGLGGDAFINSGDAAGTPVRYSTSRNALAGLGQIDLGTRYQLGCHWSIYGGYRVAAISGVATAVGQVPYNWGAPVNTICADDTVILHGAYMGAQFAW
jgi:hypothetical protein